MYQTCSEIFKPTILYLQVCIRLVYSCSRFHCQHIMTPTKDIVVCVKHWLVNYKTCKKRSSSPSRSTLYFFKSKIFCSSKFRCTSTSFQFSIIGILRNLLQQLSTIKTHWFSQKCTVYLLEWNFPFKHLKIAPFLVLKELRNFNTTIWLIRLHIELNNILTLRTLSKDLDFIITTLMKNLKIPLIT